jgi:hypothetical protein
VLLIFSQVVYQEVIKDEMTAVFHQCFLVVVAAKPGCVSSNELGPGFEGEYKEESGSACARNYSFLLF